jgi:TPR repeat protein
MFDNGEGVAQDKAEAMQLYRLAAAQGLAEAQFNLGYMFDNGEYVAQDKAEAMRLYRLASAQGLAEAQCHLGYMFDNGEGVAQDKAEAMRLYRLAAAQGLAEAQFNLGLKFTNGEGSAELDADSFAKMVSIDHHEYGDKIEKVNVLKRVIQIPHTLIPEVLSFWQKMIVKFFPHVYHKEEDERDLEIGEGSTEIEGLGIEEP